MTHFVVPGDAIAHPSALLTGQDLMAALKLAPGPHIGRLLAEIQLARAEGKITTEAEALALALGVSQNEHQGRVISDRVQLHKSSFIKAAS
jgi:tRNA nucleotidyltransferase (CCA-adding enzyme)